MLRKDHGCVSDIGPSCEIQTLPIGVLIMRIEDVTEVSVMAFWNGVNPKLQQTSCLEEAAQEVATLATEKKIFAGG